MPSVGGSSALRTAELGHSGLRSGALNEVRAREEGLCVARGCLQRGSRPRVIRCGTGGPTAGRCGPHREQGWAGGSRAFAGQEAESFAGEGCFEQPQHTLRHGITFL